MKPLIFIRRFSPFWFVKQKYFSLSIWQRTACLLTAGVLVSVLVLTIVNHPKAQAVTVPFASSGTWTVPAGVSTATFEAWGGGGAAGGTSTSSTGGGGGAGAQYAAVNNYTVTTGDAYTVTVAAVATGTTGSGAVGNDSYLTNPSSNVIVQAKGGNGGISDGGSGGASSSSNGIGDVVIPGGNGYAASSSGGGGGGGGGGSSGQGGDALLTAGGAGASTNGGNGGDGIAAVRGAGNPGSNYGGGGGGGFKTSGPSQVGGGGAQGFVQITYTFNNPPSAPTLSTPASGATGVALVPQFMLRTTDADGDYLQYQIVIYQSDCSTAVGTINQTAAQVGWSGQDTQGGTAYIGDPVVTSSTLATYAYQSSLNAGTTYCWKAAAIDPGGTNGFGSFSPTQTFTTLSNDAPASPSLSSPTNNATGVDTGPVFQLSSTDINGDDVQYKIELCSINDCSSVIRTINQVTSQVGWSGQDAQSGTAYASGTMAMHSYQPVALSASTQYWWRAYTTDPFGTNTWSVPSSIATFTTGTATSSPIIIQNNTTITNGVNLSN